MYAFTPNGVCTTCPGCGQMTRVFELVPIKVGTPPAFRKIETGRWDWDRNEAETRLVRFPQTRKVDGCPGCRDTIAAQQRTGGYDYLVPKTRPALADPRTAQMPRLVKRPRGGPA